MANADSAVAVDAFSWPAASGNADPFGVINVEFDLRRIDDPPIKVVVLPQTCRE